LKAWLLDQAESFGKFFCFYRKVGSYMAHTVLDNWKVLPRLMMFVTTVMYIRCLEWAMGQPDLSVSQAGLISVVTGTFTAAFSIWMGKESKTSVTSTGSTSKVEYEVDK